MQGIKTNQVVLNLGLANNPYSMVEDIVELVNTTNLNTFDTSVRFIDGEYNGEAERTAVISCITSNASDIREDIEKLCVIFTQERIAVMVDNKRGAVIDHPFMNLNAMLFDAKYFIK
jgi:hypothetical protein